MNDRMFGRRGLNQQTKTRVFRAEKAEPVEVVIAKPPMSPGRIALAVFGIIVGIGILNHSQKADTQSPVSAAPAKVVAKSSLPRRCGATLAEYQSLQIGSSLDQATRTIGCRGTELSRVAYGGQETIMVSWPSEAGGFSNMNATFDNDRLVAKGQLGLE